MAEPLTKSIKPQDFGSRMNTFVINLDKSVDRLTEITERLDRLGLAFTRVSAVYGGNLNERELNQHYDSSLNKRNYRRPLAASEIGCYLSHRKIWQVVVDKGLSMALVLEDDAAPAPELPAVLAEIELLSHQWDIIKLYEPPAKKSVARSIPINDRLSLCQYKKIPSCATGYVVSLAGATKLLGARESFGRPIDDDMQFYWEYSGNVYGVKPQPIFCAESSQQSTIGINGKTRSRKTFIGTMLGPLLRLAYEVLRLYHNSRRENLRH